MIADIEAVEEHNADWIEWALEQITTIAVENDIFTSDALRSAMVRDKRVHCHKNAIGAVFNIAANAGMIKRTGFVRSLWPTNHGRFISVWTLAGGTDE